MTALPNASIFFQALADALEVDPSAFSSDLSAPFASLGIDWDSLAIISTIALADEYFGIMLPGQQLSECTCPSDLVNLISSLKS